MTHQDLVPDSPRPARLAADRPRAAQDDPERGDVPGWVLVTLMTAGLVMTLWGLATGLLSDLFQDAVTGVTAPR